jgi:hypothetical protein
MYDPEDKPEPTWSAVAFAVPVMAVVGSLVWALVLFIVR